VTNPKRWELTQLRGISSTYSFEAEPFQQWGLGTDMMIGLGRVAGYAIWFSKTHLPPTHDWIHSGNDDLPTVEVNVIFRILGEIGFTSLLSCLRLSFSRSTVSIYVLYKRQQEAVEICSRSPPPRTPADGHWCPMIAPTRTHTSRWTLMPNDSTNKNPHLDFALI